MDALYPSLESELACPSRYHRTRQRERVRAPFANSELGRALHRQIAQTIQKQAVQPFGYRLPKLLWLESGADLEALQAQNRGAYAGFVERYLPWLLASQVEAERRIEVVQSVAGAPVKVTGKVDAIRQSPAGIEILDWKTSCVDRAENQLQLYLVLYFWATGIKPFRARAVDLSGGEYLEVGWDDNLLEWAEEYLAKLLRRLNETRGQSEPKPGAACRWCPFADQCPLSQAPPRVLVNTWTGEVGTC